MSCASFEETVIKSNVKASTDDFNMKILTSLSNLESTVAVNQAELKSTKEAVGDLKTSFNKLDGRFFTLSVGLLLGFLGIIGVLLLPYLEFFNKFGG